MIWWLILFFVAGMALLFSEFFLPGAVLGLIGGLLIIISAVTGVYTYPEYALFIIAGELLGSGLCVVMGFWVLTRTRASKLLTLDHAQKAESGYVSAVSDLSLVGREGVVLTALRPAGTIKIGEQRIDAVSDGVFVEEGTRVAVVQVHGSRVVVEPVAVRAAQY